MQGVAAALTQGLGHPHSVQGWGAPTQHAEVGASTQRAGSGALMQRQHTGAGEGGTSLTRVWGEGEVGDRKNKCEQGAR